LGFFGSRLVPAGEGSERVSADAVGATGSATVPSPSGVASAAGPLSPRFSVGERLPRQLGGDGRAERQRAERQRAARSDGDGQGRSPRRGRRARAAARRS
jgi:hypothetical protein